jgi:hypothetical protein
VGCGGGSLGARWIARRCHRPHGTTKAEIALARQLRHLPVAEAAWTAGAIGAAQVKVLGRLRRPATEALLARDEELLVDIATRLAFHRFVRAAAYWAQQADPDGEDEHAVDQRDRRRFHLSQSFDQLWYSDGLFDPIAGAVIAREVDRLEKEMFDADWAAARARLGRDPKVADLARTAAQRRADALVEMAIRSATAPADGRRPEPLFTVLVGWETLHGRILQLANGTVVTPAAVVPWLDQAWLELVVFTTRSRVIDIGVTRRLFSGATRRAVEVRDQECFHDLCDEPAGRCQVDHIIPYTAGGTTVQDNGRLACGFHNRGRHQHPPEPPATGPPDPPDG